MSSETTAAAREEVMKCEQEIHAIKAALRRVGTIASSSSSSSSDSDNANDQNSMEIVLLKVIQRLTGSSAVFLLCVFVYPPLI
jgi:copper chaperone CopZ